MIEPVNRELSIRKQCLLLAIARSSYYYRSQATGDDYLDVMRAIDRIYIERPYYGSRRIRHELRKQGYKVGRSKVRTCMRLMGIQAIYPRKRLSQPNKEHKIYPYRIKGLEVDRPNVVWSADITYIPMQKGFVYLVAILDWYSRYVLSWRISTTLEADFCIEALSEALSKGKPEYFNTDQGCQFTCRGFTEKLKAEGTQISMDGKGRVFDNIFVERLWRTIKQEEVYLKEYESVLECKVSLREYLDFYNNERGHQALDYCTPAQVHLGQLALKAS